MSENQNPIITKCQNGHFYDQAKYPTCPYCNPADNQANTPSIPQADTTPVPPVSSTAEKGHTEILYPLKSRSADSSTEGKTEQVFESVVQSAPKTENKPVNKCAKCGAELEAGAKFCGKCGALVTEPEKKCPKCGAVIEAQYAFCNICGTPIDKQENIPTPSENTPKPSANGNNSASATPEPQTPPVNQGVNTSNPATTPAKKKKGLIPILIATAAVIVLGSILIVTILTGIRNKSKDKEEYLFYVKDGALYTLEKDKPIKITGDLFISDTSTPYYISLIMSQCHRKDNKVLYFDKVEDAEGSNGEYGQLIYKKNIKKDDQKLKIESDMPLQHVITNQQDGYNGTSISKSFQDSVITNPDLTKVLYIKEGSLYLYDIKKEQKDKIANDVLDYIADENLDNILFIDSENRLYLKSGKEEKEKIANDVDINTLLSYTSRTFRKDEIFYTINDEEGGKSVYRYSKDGNNKLAEGTHAGFLTYDGDGALLYCTNETREYYDSLNGTLYSYYSYQNGQSKFLCEGYNISYDLENSLFAIKDEDDLYHLYWKNCSCVLSELEDNEINDLVINDKTSILFLTAHEKLKKDHDTGYFIKVSKKKDALILKTIKTYEDVSAKYEFYDDGNLLFLTDYNKNKDAGELYASTMHIDTDVNRLYYAAIVDGAIVYETDYIDKSGKYTLKIHKRNKNKQISEDVNSHCFANKGSIYYLYDYSSKKNRGELHVYKGNKSQKIDDDVTAIISTR